MSTEKIPEGSPAGRHRWTKVLASSSVNSFITGSKKSKKKTKKQTLSLNDFLGNKSSSPASSKANWADATEDIDPSGEAVSSYLYAE